MRFLVDECTGPAVARWLREQQHDVFSVYDEDRGADDGSILERARIEDRILITIDKDFGEHVFRDKVPHRGVVLLRLRDERSPSKIAALKRLIEGYGAQLVGRFVVVTERSVRIVGGGPNGSSQAEEPGP
jgi:predicted nuclease of predicted toxin-antitoxin system